MVKTPETKPAKVARTAVLMVIITVSAKLLGMLRDILLAGAYGTETQEAIAYSTASKLPLLIFDFVIGGVVTATFIPVFNEALVKKGREEALRFANQYVNAILLLTTALTLIGMGAADPLIRLIAPGVPQSVHTLAVSLTRILFPMVIFTGLAFSFVGLLQSFGHFLWPTVISLVSNAIMVLYFVGFNRHYGIYGLAVAMLLGWASQAFVQLPVVHRTGFRFRPTLSLASPYLKQSLVMAVPILVSSWGQPMCNLLNTRFASSIADGRAIPAIDYANRLYLILVGVFTFVATNLLFPYLAKAETRGDTEETKRITSTSLRVLLWIILPLTAGMVVLTEPLISVIYEHGVFDAGDVKMTASALRFFALGMPFYAVNDVYTKKFFAARRPVFPMVTALVSILCNFGFVVFLARRFGVAGIAGASAAAVLVNAGLNHWLLARGGDPVFDRSDIVELLKVTAAAVGMGGAVCGLNRLLSLPALPSMAVCVPAGVLLYVLLCLLLREREAVTVLQKLRGRTEGENT